MALQLKESDRFAGSFIDEVLWRLRMEEPRAYNCGFGETNEEFKKRIVEEVLERHTKNVSNKWYER